MVGVQFNKKVDSITRHLFSLMLICIPLSFSVDWSDSQINIPIEPILAVLALLLIYVIDIKSLLHSKFLKHPLTIAGLAYHLWMLLMIPFSSDVVVSLKYTLANLTAYWVFYFGFYYYSKKQGNNILHWAGFYSLGFLALMIYAWINHGLYNFSMDTAPIVVRPFYNDHAIYGASAAMLIAFFFIRDAPDSLKHGYRIFMGIGLGVALFLSFSRAAWLSIFAGVGFIFVVKFLNLKFVSLVGGVFILTILFGILLSGNSTFSTVSAESKKGNILEHLKSMGNITNDVSNLERLNRYRCAIRMWIDRPITGFGAGTYQKAYLTYQRADEMTRLSVTTSRAPDGKPHPVGRGGGAHSEYFQALAELGLPGLIGWLGFVLISIYTALNLYNHPGNLKQKTIILAILFSLTTYFTHALFNDFLHSEEIAALFWAAMSALVVYDGYE